MSEAWPWSVLQIAPTDDRATIRSAYAARLKALDPDLNADAFQALREARDFALAGYFVADEPDDDDDPAALTELDDVDIAALMAMGSGYDPVADEPVPAPPVDKHDDTLSRDHQALADLLFTEGDPPPLPDADEAARMTELVDRILAHPTLQSVDNHAAASDWFAVVLAQTAPRSDVILRRVASAFHWRSIDEIRRAPAQNFLIARLDAIDFADQLARKDHPLHRAWAELTRPADESSRRGWVLQKNINELLALIRTRYPALRERLDWYRLTLWEDRPTLVSRWRIVVFAVIVLIQFTRFCDSPPTPYVETPPLTPIAVPLTNRAADIDPLAKALSGGLVDAKRLQEQNPALYAVFETNWQSAKQAGRDRRQFVEDQARLFAPRLDEVPAYAPLPVLDQWRILEFDRATALRGRTVTACALFFREGLDPVSDPYAGRARELRAERLLALDVRRPAPEPRGPTSSFALTGPMIADVARRTDLDRAIVVQALALKGSDTNVCAVHRALLSSIGALPPAERTRVMRDMAD